MGKMVDVLTYNVRLYKNIYTLRRNTSLKRSELERIQKKKLRAIIKHAYHNVPFYHKIFDSLNVKPDDFKTVDDLSKLPVITKSQVKCAGSDIIARNVDINNCRKFTTSGSTGTSLSIFFNKKDLSVRRSAYIRTMRENGTRGGDIGLDLTGPHNVSMPKNNKSRYYSTIEGILERSFGTPKTTGVSVFENIENQVTILKKTKPEVISGYPMSIKLLAMAVQDKSISINPRLIFTYSEVLDKESRNVISSVFGTDPIDGYGSIETGRMAWECSEHAGYHMDVDTVVMEFIRDNQKISANEKGEVVATNLHSYAMPLIRYKVGDISTPSDEQCPCGRGLPLMKDIWGRSDDFVKLPDGRILSPTAVNLIMDPFLSMLLNFKIIQERVDRFTVELVKGNDFSEDIIPKIETRFKDIFGDNIQVEPRIIDEITKDKSGKLRAVVSKVNVFE